MAQYRHGVYIQEQATSIATPAQANSALPVFVGVAPVHHLTDSSAAPVNEPKLIYSFSEFVSTFGAPGETENKEDFPLYQAAEVYLGRYGVAPAVFINVFDPARHKDEDGTADVSKVKDEDIIGGVDAAGNRTGLSLVDEVYPRFRLGTRPCPGSRPQRTCRIHRSRCRGFRRFRVLQGHGALWCARFCL